LFPSWVIFFSMKFFQHKTVKAIFIEIVL
jgi:hypothetical protein